MAECDICIEPFTKIKRAKITCVKCEFICCKQCFIKYITMPENFFQCMSCRSVFERSILYKFLGTTFMSTTYRDCQAIIVYDRERIYFPETQEFIISKKNKIKLLKEIREYEEEYTEFKYTVREASKQLSKADMVILKGELNNVKELLNIKRLEYRDNYENNKSSKKIKTSTYILQCTYDDCKGTLIKEEVNDKGNYECPVCDKITCKTCRMSITTPSHECDPDIVKTVQMMDRSSKPCPRCSAHIYKISGCSQMFCTVCKCAFDWNTLIISKGFMHNPHYLEWVRQLRLEGKEVPTNNNTNTNNARLDDCDNFMTIEIGILLGEEAKKKIYEDGSSKEIKKFNINKKYTDADIHRVAYLGSHISNIIRLAIHYREVVCPRLDVPYDVNTNYKIRLEYLSNTMNKEEFMKIIQRRNKSRELNTELLQIFRLFVSGLNDIVMRCYYKRNRTLSDLFNMFIAIDEFIKYVDVNLKDISKIYGTTKRNIISFQ